MNVLRFAEDYPKLKKKKFTTIRSTAKKLKGGDYVTVKSVTMEFPAKITKCIERPLELIPKSILIADTGRVKKEEQMEELRRFYPDLQWDSWVKLYFLKRY